MHREIALAGLLILANGCRDEVPDVTASVPLPEPDERLEVERAELLDRAQTAHQLAELDQRKPGKVLHEYLYAKGFDPGQGPNDSYGERVEYRHLDQPDLKLTHTFVLRNYTRRGSRDAAALASVTLIVEGPDRAQTTIHDFGLIAPDGKFAAATELIATDRGMVVEAKGWWGCVLDRLPPKCPGTCGMAISTCSVEPFGTWTRYLACVGISCGQCLSKALACCSCDCDWWCKWGVGRCDR